MRQATSRMLADAARVLSAVQATPAAQLTPATRHALAQTCLQLEPVLAAVRALPARHPLANAAAQHLASAASILDAVAQAPEDWAGMPRVAEVLQMIGDVRGQLALGAITSERQAVRRRGKPSTDAADTGRDERLRRYHARQVAAGVIDPTSATAAEFEISTRRVRQILTG